MVPRIDVQRVSKRFLLPHARAQTVHDALRFLWARHTPQSLDALHDVTCTVMPGEFVGIIGRNGSGKSTLLKVLAGIYLPTTGQVTVRGRMSAFLELGVGFHPELSGRENVFLNGIVCGLSRQRLQESYGDIVAFAGLEKFMDLPLKHFSSGMQVRLAFSVAIHVPADILLLDEVLAVGDAEFQERCFQVFTKFQKEGKTVVLVTHDLASLRAFAQRAILLDHGRVIRDGAPEEVIARYRALPRESESEHARSEPELRFGDHKAVITGLRMLNDAQQPTTAFAAGDLMTIQMDVAFRENAAHPVFGITVRDAYCRNVFVTNTSWQQVDTGTYRGGERVTVSFRIANALSSGQYTISPAIAHPNLRTFHDWRENLGAFSVDRLVDTGGIADLPHDIVINRALAPVSRER